MESNDSKSSRGHKEKRTRFFRALCIDVNPPLPLLSLHRRGWKRRHEGAAVNRATRERTLDFANARFRLLLRGFAILGISPSRFNVACEINRHWFYITFSILGKCFNQFSIRRYEFNLVLHPRETIRMI